MESRGRWDGIWIMLLAGVVFTLGVNWGLPSRASDAYLFGDRTPWTGQEIKSLIGDQQSDRGADVDANPIMDRSRPVLVNRTDAQRAEIVRRYRLYSHQPDEMNTFMSLSKMKPGKMDLDPRMYKYGGLWVYPVGAIIAAAGRMGLIDVRDDIAFYLDHPEEFGKFYIAARLYSAAWGVLGAYVVWRLCRRLLSGIGARTDGMKHPERVYRWLAVAGAVMFILMPITVNMAHEAKPHLAGMVLGLIGCGYAMRYIALPNLKNALFTGLFCGLSMGMVLTGAMSLILLPAMFLLSWRCSQDRVVDVKTMSETARRLREWEQSTGVVKNDHQSDIDHLQDYVRRNIAIPYRPWPTRLGHLLWGALLAGLVYCITNPYVPINYFRNPSLLMENLKNSSDFYSVGVQANHMARLMLTCVYATGFIVFIGGISAMAASAKMILIRWKRRNTTASPVLTRFLRYWLLLSIVCVTGLIPFIVFADGQAMDYARFAALPFAVMATLCVIVPAGASHSLFCRFAGMGAVAIMGFLAAHYEVSYLQDSPTDNTRINAARIIARTPPAGNLGLWVEPAPFSTPPVNLFLWDIYLLPRGQQTSGERIELDAAILMPDWVLSDWNIQGSRWSSYVHPLSWAERNVQWKSR